MSVRAKMNLTSITEEKYVRRLFVRLIAFVAQARSSDRAKNDALDAIEKLQARMLP